MSSIGSFEIGFSAIGGRVLPPQVTQQKIIPSYLYQEYSDDNDLQAFVESYTALAQAFLDWFNTVGCSLAIYTLDDIHDELLDWVGEGIYGIPRPVFPSGTYSLIGPLDTWACNEIECNGVIRIGSGQVFVTDDDVYKRVITWNFYKGDGNQFNPRWLKRRIMRFLLGTNGLDFNVDSTYRISVTYDGTGGVTILIINGLRTVTGGAICDMFACNEVTCGQIDTTFQPLTTPFFDANLINIMAQGIASGVLQTPFQLRFTVIIGSYDGIATGGFVFGVSAFGTGSF